MSTPNTYLLTPPLGERNPFGTMLHSNDLIKGLRMANRRLHVPDPSVQPHYPGKDVGMTTLWLGRPLSPEGKKLCAFTLGPLPEWTQLEPTGIIRMRGWRNILELCWKRGLASKTRLEQIFKVTLGVAGRDGSCPQCRREGSYKSADGGLACALHNNVGVNVRASQQFRKDAPIAAASRADFARRNPTSVNVKGV